MRRLRDLRVTPGERVALRLLPGPVYPAMILALLRAGAVAVPISTRIPENTVPALLGRIRCRRLIVDRGGAQSSPQGIEAIEAAALVPEVLGERSFETPGVPPCPRGNEAGDAPFDRSADATIVFTSGSTGVPKAVLHAFENHWASAVGSNRNIPLRPGDRWLLSLPLWHVGGLAVLFRCVLGGAAVAIPGRSEPLVDAIAGLGATHVSLVATQLYRLLRDERGREILRSLKAVLLGGGPTPGALIEEAAAVGVRLVTSYGSTEMASQATATRPGEPAEALSSSGRPLAFREVSVTADGEILVRGRVLFGGYVDAGAVRSSRDAAGWFHTGDLGQLDADRMLVVTGRRDAMFISGGENIHPEEIEREILHHPGILEAVVVPVPDPEFGSRPAAFVRTAGGEFPDTAALDRFLRATLPGFKIPVRYLRWPAGDTGMKPDRRALAAAALRGDWQGNLPCWPEDA